jgi:hypothetical protein
LPLRRRGGAVPRGRRAPKSLLRPSPPSRSRRGRRRLCRPCSGRANGLRTLARFPFGSRLR